jgi:hypothetical protein
MFPLSPPDIYTLLHDARNPSSERWNFKEKE